MILLKAGLTGVIGLAFRDARPVPIKKPINQLVKLAEIDVSGKNCRSQLIKR